MIGKRLSKNKDKSLSNRVYCTIDGVLTPVVYKALETDYITYTDLYVTNEKRIAQQSSLTNASSLSKPFKEVVGSSEVKVNPICVFDYHSKIKESSNKVSYWWSSYGSTYFSQLTAELQPVIGRFGAGVNGDSPIYFFNKSFLTLSDSITLSGDFTVFLYVEPIPEVANVHTNHRFLGKSDDANMYFSIGESLYRSYRLMFSSSSFVDISASGLYWRPTAKKLLITLQRSGSTLYIRENGVQVASETIPTTDFTFNQFGRIGGVTSPTYNGSLIHFSAYDGFLDSSLETVENAIIKSAQKAKG